MDPKFALDNNLSDISGRDNTGQTSLSRAAKNGDEDVVRKLLAYTDIDVDIRDYQGRTPLWLAAERGHSHIVHQLLERGANPNLEDLDGITPLWKASSKGHASVVGLLINCGRMTNWNARQFFFSYEDAGKTALTAALGNKAVSDMLLQVDEVDPLVSSDKGDSLYRAIEINDVDVAYALLDKYGVRSHGSDLLTKAINYRARRDQNMDDAEAFEKYTNAENHKNLQLIERLLTKYGVDPNQKNKYGHRPLALAINADKPAAARFLLAHEKIQPCMDDILEYMGYHKGPELAKVLQADGRFDTKYVNDKSGHTFLSLMAKLRQETFVEELLRLYADDETMDPDQADHEGRTPLSYAVDEMAYPDITRMLLRTGRVKLNSVDNTGMSPLCYAAKGGSHDATKIMLEHPDIDPNNGNGKFLPLVLVFDHFRHETLDALLAHPRTDSNQADAEGRTALAVGTQYGYEIEAVEKLAALPGADPGYQDAKGVTAFHEAARQKTHETAVRLMEILLGVEGNPDKADADGRTPLSLAAEQGHIGVVDMLLSVESVRPDVKDARGRGPLSWAIASTAGGPELINARLKVIRNLLDQEEVDPNARDVDGMTPLIHAVLWHGCSGSMIHLLLEHDDLDVHQTDRNGCTAMDVAKAYADTTSMALLRVRGAFDDGKAKFGILADMDDTGLLEVYLGRQERKETDTKIARKLSDAYSVHHHMLEWDDYSWTRDSLLPLGKPDDDDGEADDDCLCSKCKAIDLDAMFSKTGHTVRLGCVDASWETRSCALCRLIAIIHPGYRDSRAVDDTQPSVLKSFGTTWFGSAYCNWSENWIDTKVLAVLHEDDLEKYSDTGSDDHWQNHSHIFEVATIGRLGCNCPYGMQSLIIKAITKKPSTRLVNLDTAKGWISYCQEHHKLEPCTRPQRDHIPHFRLIECATGKVVAMEELGPNVPPYAALSYVGGQPARGIQATTQGISSMSAVVRGQKLGYDYIWVDQHCVVQTGNDLVKGSQLRTMDLVYANAEVTLVAAAGKDATAGLPGASPGRPRQGWPVVNLHGGLHTLTGIPPYPAHYVRSSSTWWTRGWTYQEGVLACRKLFFSDHEMFFECGSCLTRREAVHIPLEIHSHYDNSGRSLEPLIFSRQWHLFSILEEYTSRRLTYSNAALNALLGILRVYAQRDKYPLYHLCGVPIVAIGRREDAGVEEDGDGYANISQPIYTNNEDKNDSNTPPDTYPLDTLSIANAPAWRPNYRFDGWKDFQLAVNRRVGNLTGFVHGLFWRLEEPALRRAEFPSWSWAGWTGMIRQRLQHGINRTEKDLHRVWIVPGDVALSVVVPAKDHCGPETYIPWDDFYNMLVAGTDERCLVQQCVLAITAPVVSIRFHEGEKDSPESSGTEFMGFVLRGNSVWKGDFYPTRKDAYPDTAGQVSNFRQRLLSESWLGILLRLAPASDKRMMSSVLVLEVMPTRAGKTDRNWERIGVLKLRHSIGGHTLEYRTIRLA